MWTEADKKALRSLRILADAPPPSLPRFRVEPTDQPGWYRVVDAMRQFRPVYDFGPEHFPDPRAAAEDSAQQLTARHDADHNSEEA